MHTSDGITLSSGWRSSSSSSSGCYREVLMYNVPMHAERPYNCLPVVLISGAVTCQST
jgi:hypothetical protein